MKTIQIDNDDEPALSMTSMMDIVFLLLIFFILQPFKAPEKRIPNELPKYMGPPIAALNRPISNITVAVWPHSAGRPDSARFQVDNLNVRDSDDPEQAIANLASFIRDAADNDVTIPVIIKAGPKVKFRHVVTAMDACQSAKMLDVKFAPL